MKTSKTHKEKSGNVKTEKHIWQRPSITALPIHQTAQDELPLRPPQPS